MDPGVGDTCVREEYTVPESPIGPNASLQNDNSFSNGAYPVPAAPKVANSLAISCTPNVNSTELQLGSLNNKFSQVHMYRSDLIRLR
jgi:hypothetical protein